ncbi:MAG TPA: DoxX family protein [Puia sp.]
MKTTKIMYWIFTTLFVIFMLFSAIASWFPKPEGIAMMKHLGYPYSVLTFLSVAKILGIIAILIPGFPRLKEWAYAGFTFDLIGATFAGLSAGDPLMQWIPVLLGLVFIFGSYILYHRIKNQSAVRR